MNSSAQLLTVLGILVPLVIPFIVPIIASWKWTSRQKDLAGFILCMLVGVAGAVLEHSLWSGVPVTPQLIGVLWSVVFLTAKGFYFLLRQFGFTSSWMDRLLNCVGNKG
jgi:uncharacterized membrane protein YeaQ/YmgE (transglycosylase-associated protein family)